MKRIAVIVLALLLAAPAFAGKTKVERTVPVDHDGEVSIELIAGTVRVTTWERSEVRISGTIDDEFEELEVDADDGDVQIEVGLIEDEDGDVNLKSAAELDIVVPVQVELSIETVSGELSVDGVGGRLEIENVSGGVDLSGPLEDVEVECISGQVDVVVDGALRSGDFETVAGNIDFRGRLTDDARLSLESINGNITLRLPSDTLAHFNVETFSGDIENEFGPEATKTSDFLPSKELSFSTGSGGARVEVAAFNGTVKLIKE